MTRRSARAFVFTLVWGLGLGAGFARSGDEQVGDARLTPLTFAALDGWTGDDHAAALAAFARSCATMLADAPVLRTGKAADPRLMATCLNLPPEHGRGGTAARAFFEANFTPFAVTPPSGTGFLTGYFEPEYEGALERSEDFATPLLARPDELVTLEPGETRPGLAPDLAAAWRTPAGLVAAPDRAAIEDGGLGAAARPIVWLRQPAEAFIIHVQGSARIRLAGGGTLRVAYAGRNGQPYSSIGRLIVERGHVPLAEMNLERMLDWLKANPAEARDIMRTNRSYIFFRSADELDAADGPIGGLGIPLTPGRSLAVDRTLWSYGLPFWLSGALPGPDGRDTPLRRLMIAQDTGSAILGAARGDYFFGTGAVAGTRAGLTRHRPAFVVLRPKPAP